MSDDVDTSEDGATVAAYDIARLAGVGRAAVSNWRRRYADFPQPVAGTAASPLYALSDIESWLAAHGKQFQLSPGDRVWQQIRGTVDDLRLGEVLGSLGAFLVFVRRDPDRWRTLATRNDETLARQLATAIGKTVPEVPDGLTLDATSVGILRAAADAAGNNDHRQVFDFACDRYLEIQARRWRGTTPPVAQLMVEFAAATGGTVLDPACGVGGLLLAAHDHGAEAVLGQEADGTAARLAAARLLLHDARPRIHTGDSLRADGYAGEQVDAVVCNPPFHERSWGYEELAGDPRWEFGLPPRGEPELAWVQHCLGHVAVGGTVAIMMPAGAASRRAGRRIRSNLLRAGALRAVVTLPSAGPGTAGVADLWVLRRPDPGATAPSEVLLAEATRDLPAASTAWHTFLAGRAVSGSATVVRIIDLLDDEVDISPARHLARPAADDGVGFRPMGEALSKLAERLAAGLPDLAEADQPSPPPEVTLGELVRAGVVTVQHAPLRMDIDSGETPVLTARDVRHRRAPSGRTGQAPGLVTLRPGDVVTTAAAREPVALVMADGGAALGPQLHLLRPDPERLDPHFLAGFLRIRQGQGGGQRGGSISRSDVHRVALPRLPIEEQRRYGDAFRQLTSFEDSAREMTSLAETLVREGLAGLAAGNLKPRSGH